MPEVAGGDGADDQECGESEVFTDDEVLRNMCSLNPSHSWLVNCVLLRDADEACEENAGGNEARVC